MSKEDKNTSSLSQEYIKVLIGCLARNLNELLASPENAYLIQELNLQVKQRIQEPGRIYNTLVAWWLEESKKEGSGIDIFPIARAFLSVLTRREVQTIPGVDVDILEKFVNSRGTEASLEIMSILSEYQNILAKAIAYANNTGTVLNFSSNLKSQRSSATLKQRWINETEKMMEVIHRANQASLEINSQPWIYTPDFIEKIKKAVSQLQDEGQYRITYGTIADFLSLHFGIKTNEQKLANFSERYPGIIPRPTTMQEKKRQEIVLEVKSLQEEASLKGEKIGKRDLVKYIMDETGLSEEQARKILTRKAEIRDKIRWNAEITTNTGEFITLAQLMQQAGEYAEKEKLDIRGEYKYFITLLENSGLKISLTYFSYHSRKNRVRKGKGNKHRS